MSYISMAVVHFLDTTVSFYSCNNNISLHTGKHEFQNDVRDDGQLQPSHQSRSKRNAHQRTTSPDHTSVFDNQSQLA